MNTDHAAAGYLLVYAGFFDLSRDDGKSINEREFVKELLRRKDAGVVYVGPNTKEAVELPSERVVSVGFLNRSIGSQVKYQLRLAAVLRRLHRTHGGRMVIACRPNYASVSVPIFAKAAGVPLIVKFAGLPTILSEKRKDIALAYRLAADAAYNMNGRTADRIWAVTENISRYWQERLNRGPESCFVLSNGVNTHHFNPDAASELPPDIEKRIPPAARYIGYAGGLRKILGIEFLIDALDILRRQGREYAVLVAGDGPERETLEKKILGKNLQDRFVMLGHLPYDNMPAFYRWCDVLVAPFSRAFVDNFGSSSQKVFQYLACGKPVVAVSAPDHAFLEEEGLGRTVVCENVEALAEGIAGAAEEIESTEKSRQRCDYVCRNRSYGVLVERFLRVVDRVWTEGQR